jgi:multiple sugar transport system permease protein
VALTERTTRADEDDPPRVVRRRRRRIDITPLLFLTPVLAVLLLIRVAPMFYGLWLSLTKWDGIGSPQYVGLKNYRLLLSDPDIITALKNNVIFAVALIVGMIVPMVIAVLLHNGIWGWKFFRLVFFIPAVLSPLVIGIYWSAFLVSSGPLDAGLRGAGLKGLSKHLWLIDTSTSIPIIGLILIWSTFGTGVILFMAGLAGINPSLYDAAKVDGASAAQIFRHVTFPGLAPVTVFWAIQVLIFSFTNLFAFIYALTFGGPGHSTSVIEFTLYSEAFQGGFLGYASAIGTFMLAIVFVIVIVLMFGFSRQVEDAS